MGDPRARREGAVKPVNDGRCCGWWPGRRCLNNGTIICMWCGKLFCRSHVYQAETRHECHECAEERIEKHPALKGLPGRQKEVSW